MSFWFELSRLTVCVLILFQNYIILVKFDLNGKEKVINLFYFIPSCYDIRIMWLAMILSSTDLQPWINRL